MIAVDIRPGSPTLGQVVTLEASDAEPVLFWAPASFARGFAALEDPTEIEYFCTATYDPRHESGIRWDDPTLGIAWPVADPLSCRPRTPPPGPLADWLARPESAAFAWRPPQPLGGLAVGAPGTFGWCRVDTPRWQHRRMQRRRVPGGRLAPRTRAGARRRAASTPSCSSAACCS